MQTQTQPAQVRPSLPVQQSSKSDKKRAKRQGKSVFTPLPNESQYAASIAEVPLPLPDPLFAFKPEEMERVMEVRSVIGRVVSHEELATIETAHHIGTPDAEGKYTLGDIRQKAEVLKSGGFDTTERRELMESGMVGSALVSKTQQGLSRDEARRLRELPELLKEHRAFLSGRFFESMSQKNFEEFMTQHIRFLGEEARRLHLIHTIATEKNMNSEMQNAQHTADMIIGENSQLLMKINQSHNRSLSSLSSALLAGHKTALTVLQNIRKGRA